MRGVALFVLALAAGCNKTTDVATDDTDLDADTEVVDTDGGPPATKAFEVDPDVTAQYTATFSMNGSGETYSLTDDVTYSVTKLADQGWFRHFAGSVQVDNVWTESPEFITLAMDVVVPDATVTTGRQSCKGATGYAVIVGLKAAQNIGAFSSLGLQQNDAGPCNINIQEISTERFQATIATATVVGGQDSQIVAVVEDATIDIKLRPKE